MIWKTIPNYSRYEANADGDVRHKDKHNLLKSTMIKGYCKLSLFNDANEKKQVFRHRVVWQAMVGTIPHKMQINHKDGVKTNNALANLEVVTARENLMHAIAMGLSPVGDLHPNRLRPERCVRGEAHHFAKVTEADVIRIRAVLTEGTQTQRELAREYNVSRQVIFAIKHRLTWKHL